MHHLADLLYRHVFKRRNILTGLLRHELFEGGFLHRTHLVIHKECNGQRFIRCIELFFGSLVPFIIAVLFRIKALPQVCLIIRHDELRCLKFFLCDPFGRNVLNTAVLNAHVNDIRCVRRKRQVAPRLDKQQHQNHKNRFPVREHVLENLTHFFPFLLSGVPACRHTNSVVFGFQFLFLQSHRYDPDKQPADLHPLPLTVTSQSSQNHAFCPVPLPPFSSLALSD